MRWLKANSIVTGVFYRDVYWRFIRFGMHHSLRRMAAKPLYSLDWRLFYNKADHLFLPTLRMAAYLPQVVRDGRFSALPPGCDGSAIRDAGFPLRRRGGNGPLRLFYVGGVTPPRYDLKPALEVAKAVPYCRLTICCREKEWAGVRHLYGAERLTNVRIVHEQGEGLLRHYREADVALIALLPNEYLSFAAPYKMYEAASHGTPVLAVGDTETARIVEREGFGWSFGDLGKAVDFLREAAADGKMLGEKSRSVLERARMNTWEERARQVVDTLVQKKTAR